MKQTMWIPILAGAIIAAGVTLLLLNSIPVHNSIEGKTLTVRYIIGSRTIDMTDAHFLPVPPEATHHIVKLSGTSIGKKRSGNFLNTQTRTRFRFYLTGKGEKTYFEIGDKKYLVDGITTES